MASTIKIQQFRVSFIWFETQLSFLSRLEEPDAKNLPFSFLGRNYSYETTFEKIKQSPNGIYSLPLPEGNKLDLTLPWQTSKHSNHHFWQYYLGQQKENVTPRLAWERFVPMRGKGPFGINASWLKQPDEWIELETFYYPHGLALVATVHCNCKDNCDLDDVIEKALLVQKNGRFDVEIPGEPKGNYSLSYLAALAIDFLRKQAWGATSSPGPQFTDESFSIFTVIEGEGVDESQPVPSNAEICRILYAVTEWSGSTDPVHPFEEKKSIPISKKAGQGDVLYGADGDQPSRAVWFPDMFQHGQKGALAAYHRNLVLTTLQVESLCGLVYESSRQLSKYLTDSNPFSPFQSECLRRAVIYLKNLYTGEHSYRSKSAYTQLTNNKDIMKALNDIRMYWNMDPLASL